MDAIEVGDDAGGQDHRGIARARSHVLPDRRTRRPGWRLRAHQIDRHAGRRRRTSPGDNILCHIGAEETLESFTENLRGAQPGETKQFQAKYPDDYPDQKLAGKTYDYSVEVQGLKEKKLPELNDEFAKEAAGENGGFSTLAELRTKIRENLDASKEQQQTAQGREKILQQLVKQHDFPVPEALIEHQIDVRLERAVDRSQRRELTRAQLTLTGCPCDRSNETMQWTM